MAAYVAGGCLLYQATAATAPLTVPVFIGIVVVGTGLAMLFTLLINGAIASI